MEATDEPNDRDRPVSGRVEVALGGVVQLQCPAGTFSELFEILWTDIFNKIELACR